MEMHYLTYVFIPNNTDIEKSVAKALRPFGDALKVKPWKCYLNFDEIARMAKHYGVRKTNVSNLAGRMKDWNGGAGGVDENGLFCIHTFNPNAKWDWYVIGGRFDNIICGNMLGARTLVKHPKLADILPYDFVTPDGKWHAVETFVRTSWPHGHFVQISPERWLRKFKTALRTFANYRVVCVDRHS
jgi:hypothetical protein